MFVRAFNFCVLMLIGGVLVAPMLFQGGTMERQLGVYLPGTVMAPARAWASPDFVARLADLRVQIRTDLCSRDAPQFVQARICDRDRI
jgi:hypothetical protein